jgi:hypothetical protein
VFEVSAGVSNPDLEWRNKKMLDVTELEQSKSREDGGSLEVCWGYDIAFEDFLECRGPRNK